MMTYVARCLRSGDWWAIEVPEVPGVHTQAKRLEQVEAMAREAIALMLGIPEDSFNVEVQWELPHGAADTISSMFRARSEATNAQREATAAAQLAAWTLVEDLHLPLRDAAKVLGVSYQRVGQLLHAGGCGNGSSSS